jgi:hypothetical protein
MKSSVNSEMSKFSQLSPCLEIYKECDYAVVSPSKQENYHVRNNYTALLIIRATVSK